MWERLKILIYSSWMPLIGSHVYYSFVAWQQSATLPWRTFGNVVLSKSNMAWSAKKSRQMFSPEEVAEIFSRDSRDDGDIDSDHQDMSSGKEMSVEACQCQHCFIFIMCVIIICSIVLLSSSLSYYCLPNCSRTTKNSILLKIGHLGRN